MNIDLFNLLQRFREYKDFDNETAFFRTNVPWEAPEAYLNKIHRPAPPEFLADVVTRDKKLGEAVEKLGGKVKRPEDIP